MNIEDSRPAVRVGSVALFLSRGRRLGESRLRRAPLLQARFPSQAYHFEFLSY
jgi:hypothetical protein